MTIVERLFRRIDPDRELRAVLLADLVERRKVKDG